MTVALLLCGVNFLLLGFGGPSIPIGAESGLALFCLNSYLGFALLLGHASIQLAVTKRCAQGAAGVLAGIAVLCLPYGVYAVAAESLPDFAPLKLLIYVTLPPLICLATRRTLHSTALADTDRRAAAMAPLGVRMDDRGLGRAGSTVRFGPECAGRHLRGGVFPWCACAAWTTWAMSGASGRRTTWWRGACFLIFAPVAILLGLASGFLAIAGSFTAPGPLLFMALGIFLVIAVPEELLFRGILQNVLEKSLGHRNLALGVTAIVFGLAHLNNGPHADWRYVGLATLAGWFYGRAYLKTRNLMAPALLHTLVDTVWRGFFR